MSPRSIPSPSSCPIIRRRNSPPHPLPLQTPSSLSDQTPFLGPVPVQIFLEELVKERPGRELDGRIFRALNTLSGNASAGALMIAISRLCSSPHDDGIQASLHSLNPSIVPFFAKRSRPQGERDISRVEFFAEVLHDVNDDPFSDGEDVFLTNSGKACRRSIASYAEQIFGAQFRTHLFSFCTFGPFARIFYWDVAGVLVTERFNFVDTDFLVEFLWRFDGMTSEERGVDVSVRHLDDEWPTHLAPRHILERLRTQDTYNPPDTHGRSSRRHRNFCLMKIPNQKDAREGHDALVSFPPMFKQSSMFGRTTRPMRGYDLGTSCMVFIKQYWREDGHKEGDVYVKLKSKEVRNLPVFAGGNDVGSYHTRTQDYLNESWCRVPQTLQFPKRRLYRMALSTIGVPLTEFQTTRELVGAIRDAMQCHDDAFFKARILHRDISIGNIMIDPATRKGMLIDWDLSSAITEDGFCNDNDRTGTWLFMSSILLAYPHARHTIVDDRESAVHVLLWALLHYVKHNRYERLHLFTRMFYECGRDVHDEQFIDVGGDDKLFFFLEHSFTRRITFEGGQSIAQLVLTLQKAFFPNCKTMPWSNAPPSAHETHEKAIEHLKRQDWLVNTLTAALDDPTWTDSPRAEPNYLDRQKQDRERESRERAARQADEDDDDHSDDDGDDDDDDDDDEDEDRNVAENSKTDAKRSADDHEGCRGGKARKLCGEGDVSVALARLLTAPRSMPARF